MCVVDEVAAWLDSLKSN